MLKFDTQNNFCHVDKDGILMIDIMVPELAGTAIESDVIRSAVGKFKQELQLLLDRRSPFSR